MTREAGEKNGPKGSQVCNEENPEDCLPVHCSLIRCMTILEHGICHHDILLDSTWSERDLGERYSAWTLYDRKSCEYVL